MRKMPWDFDEPRCREVGVELFFTKDTDDPEKANLPPDYYKEAKKICKTCVHQSDCSLWGLENEVHGMWGGLTPRERMYLRKKGDTKFVGKIPSTPSR